LLLLEGESAAVIVVEFLMPPDWFPLEAVPRDRLLLVDEVVA